MPAPSRCPFFLLPSYNTTQPPLPSLPFCAACLLQCVFCFFLCCAMPAADTPLPDTTCPPLPACLLILPWPPSRVAGRGREDLPAAAIPCVLFSFILPALPATTLHTTPATLPYKHAHFTFAYTRTFPCPPATPAWYTFHHLFCHFLPFHTPPTLHCTLFPSFTYTHALHFLLCACGAVWRHLLPRHLPLPRHPSRHYYAPFTRTTPPAAAYAR